MALGSTLEVRRLQGSAVQPHALRVRHVRHEPHAGAGQAVGRHHPADSGGAIGQAAGGHELLQHRPHAGLGERIVRDDAIAGRPGREVGILGTKVTGQGLDAG